MILLFPFAHRIRLIIFSYRNQAHWYCWEVWPSSFRVRSWKGDGRQSRTPLVIRGLLQPEKPDKSRVPQDSGAQSQTKTGKTQSGLTIRPAQEHNPPEQPKLVLRPVAKKRSGQGSLYGQRPLIRKQIALVKRFKPGANKEESSLLPSPTVLQMPVSRV